MKRTFLLIFFIYVFGQIAWAQNFPDYQRTKVKGNETQVDARLRAGKTFYLPKFLTPSLNGGKDSVGAVGYNTADSSMYLYRGGGSWVKVGSGSGSSYAFGNGIATTSGITGLSGDAVWYYPGSVLIGADGKGQLYVDNNAASMSVKNVGVSEGNILIQKLGGTNLNVDLRAGTAGVGSRALVVGNNTTGAKGIEFIDDISNSGAFYANKYRSGITNRWITDKEYVDSVAAASGGVGSAVYASNGLTKEVDTVKFGGTLQKNTSLDLNGKQLIIANTGSFAQSSFILTPTIASLSFNGLTNSANFTATDDKAQMQRGAFQNLSISPEGFILTDMPEGNAGKGLNYRGVDFSNFQDSTLVTKKWVVDNFTGAGSSVPSTRLVSTGYGLSGGGDLSTNRTHAVDTAGAIVSKPYLAALNSTLVHNNRTVTAGNGLAGGGNLSANITLTADTAILATKANTKTLAQLQTALNAKQNTLVSGTNIATVNGNNLLLGGNIAISSTPDSAVFRTVANSRSLAQTQTALNLKADKATTLTNGYGINSIGDLSANRTVSVDTTSSNALVSKSRLTASLGNFNVTNAFSGLGTVASPFDLATVTVARGGSGATSLTGILKGNGTGAFSAAVAGDFPTLNQNTTGVAGTATALANSRNFWGLGFNGTANVTGKPVFTASTTGGASINIPHGVAPTSPVNGDFWTTTTGFFARINGVTYSFLPLSGGTLTGGLFGTTSEFSTYSRVGASASTHIDITSGDVKYYASNGSTLLSVYPLTLTGNRVQRYQDDDGTIALTKNYATGQTIGANTTGNAATATTAGSTNVWAGNAYAGAIAANVLNFFMVYSSTDNQWHYATPAQVKTNLATTLQDVTTAGGTVNGNNSYPIILNRTTTNGGYLGMRYDDNGLYKWFQGFRELGDADLHIYNTTTSNSHVVYKANGNTIFGGGTDNGAYKVQVTGGISATGDVGINGNISAANLAASNYTATTATSTNISTVSNGTNLYSRVGNIVTVSGVVTATNTATGPSVFVMAVPVTSNFTSANDATGTVFTVNSNGGYVYANSGSNTVFIGIGNHTNNASKEYRFTFQYIVK